MIGNEFLISMHELFRNPQGYDRKTEILTSGFLATQKLASLFSPKKDNSPSFLAGDILKTLDGRYQVVRVFKGGETTVYKARDLVLERNVSLRRIDALTKPHLIEVVKVLDKTRRRYPTIDSSTQEIYGLRTDFDGNEYLEQEWIEGETLDKYYINVKDLSGAVYRLATILRALGDAGLVHRDIKPSNIVLQDNFIARIKLLDCFLLRGFGINEGTDWDRMGTPVYAAPEQWTKGGFIGPKTDIYALGIVIGERVSGRISNGPNYKGSFEKRFPELVGSIWREIVEGCTQVDYDERWSAENILSFLERRNRTIYRRTHRGRW